MAKEDHVDQAYWEGVLPPVDGALLLWVGVLNTVQLRYTSWNLRFPLYKSKNEKNRSIFTVWIEYFGMITPASESSSWKLHTAYRLKFAL